MSSVDASIENAPSEESPGPVSPTDFHGDPLKRWQKFLVALTAATLVYGGQIRAFTDPTNRYLDFWQPMDGWAMLAGIVMLAALFTLAHELLARTCLRWAADNFFVLVVGAGLIPAVVTTPRGLLELLYCGLAVVVTVSWLRPRWRVPRRLAKVALVFSPLAAILGYQLVTYPQWATPRETPTQKFASRPANPIFIFIFDEWSYVRSTKDGEFLPFFKNLRALAGQSSVFDHAISGGPYTKISVPRFIFQTTDEIKVGPGQTFWEHGGTLTPTTRSPSLFTLARDHRYNSSLVGFYLPQRRILGDQADYIHSDNRYPKRDTFAGRIYESAVENITYLKDPVSRAVHTVVGQRLLAEDYGYWNKLLNSGRKEARAAIEHASPNSLTLIHLPIPHPPFVFDPQGNYLGAQEAGSRESIEGYMRNLAFLDQVIGGFIADIKASGEFDQAMILMTSDHSWRADFGDRDIRDGAENVRHVPLIIKYPGQHEAVRIAPKIQLTDLKPAIEAVMQGRIEEARGLFGKAAE